MNASLGPRLLKLLAALVLLCVCSLAIHEVVAGSGLVLDATRAGDHRLSARTVSLLRTIEEGADADDPWRIVLSTPLSPADDTRFAITRVRDMIDRLARSPAIDAFEIDPTGAEAQSSLRRLLSELAGRDSDASADATDQADAAFQLAESRASQVSELAAEVSASQPQPDLERLVGETRAVTVGIQELRTRFETSRTRRIAGVGVADVTDMRQVAATACARAAESASLLASLPGRAGAEAAGIRDELLAQIESLRGATTPIVHDVGTALATDEALLVIGPEGAGALAIELWRVIPTDALGTVLHADAGRRAEDLLSAAIGTLASDREVSVVFTHAEPGVVLDSSGILDVLRESLGVRGVSLVEWAVTQSQTPPASVAGKDARDVVYLVAGTNSAASGGDRGASGAERAALLAGTLRGLIDEGANVMYSVPPSTLPTLGSEDPMVEPLLEMGVRVMSAHPLLSESRERSRRVVTPDLEPVASADLGHPIAGAVGGLPLRLPWALPLFIEEPRDGWSVEPVLRFDAGSAWGESNWFGFAQIPAEQRAALSEAPRPGGVDDLESDSFTIGAACEREFGAGTQRVLVIGCNRWYFDQVARAGQRVGPRVVLQAPGNVELIGAGLSWLSHRDELIARGPGSQSVSRIRPMDPGALTALRWSVTLGIPALVLLLGGIYAFSRRG